MPGPVPSPVTPWHMWGNTVEITAQTGPAGAGTIAGPSPSQLFRVNYRRPETWSWFVGAQLVDGDISDVDLQVIVQVHFILGVGRSVFLTEGNFPGQVPVVEFRWSVPIGVRPGAGNSKKWTVRAPTPRLDDLTAGSEEKFDWLVAQDIQAKARGFLVLTAPSAVNNRVVIQISAWVAPRVHVRPDWFIEEFTGAERQGT